MEQQTAKLGGPEETRASLSALFRCMYQDCQDALLQTGTPERALGVLERSRARSLLMLMAERDLMLTADIPGDLAHERRLVATDYQRAQGALSRSSATKDEERVDELLARLRDLRQKQEEIVVEIRKASPRFAALQYPQPLGLAGVQAAIDPGTVLLSYSVGQEKTTLFVVRTPAPGTPAGTGLSVFALRIGQDALRQKVLAFRQTVSSRSGSGRGVVLTGGPATSADETLARELYDLLVRPAETQIEPAERILISPDGPLHTLPFAALLRSEGGTSRYLLEWKPIHVVVSATVYAELKKTRKEGPRATTRRFSTSPATAWWTSASR